MASDTKPAEDKPVEQKPEQKPAALGEDDEFEDFPVDGMNLLHLSHLYPQTSRETQARHLCQSS
jgi:hypothetical protein